MPRKPKAAPVQPYPICVRHAKERKDTRLRHYYMCDACADEWEKTAFAGNKPIHVGAAIRGYCGLCNTVTDAVKVRCWMLCDICHRVANSIGRNHVAEDAVLKFWKEKIEPKFPQLTIVQKDKSALHPRGEKPTTATADADFHVLENGTLLFLIEGKTGRSSLKEMGKFQLDVSDCDTILNQVRALNVPAYVIHSKVIEFWDHPPTTGYKCEGLWWTDMYTMDAHFSEIITRQDEQKQAVFFKKKAFQSCDTLADSLRDLSGWILPNRLKTDGVPAMYKITPKAAALVPPAAAPAPDPSAPAAAPAAAPA